MTPDELTRLREGAVSREAWRRKADGLREEVARLRAAIAPTSENVEALARLFARRLDECPWEEWIEEAQRGFREDAAAAFAAINERAKL